MFCHQPSFVFVFFAIITTDDGYCEKKTFVYADMINSFLDKQNNPNNIFIYYSFKRQISQKESSK
jgi:hypothetical protein